MRFCFVVILCAHLVHALGPMDRAEQFYLQGRYPEAIETARQALSHNLNDNNAARMWLLIGQSWLMQRNTAQARRAFATILSQYHRTEWLADAYVGIGDAHMHDKNYEEAIRFFENAMTQRYLAQHGAAIYYRLSRAHRASGNPERGAHFEQIIRRQYPHSLEARILLASGTQRHGGGSGPPQPQTRRVYAVQIAFTTRADYAQEYAEQFNRKGYDAHVRVTTSGGRQRFAVLLGRFAQKSDADALFRRVRTQEKIDAFVTHFDE